MSINPERSTDLVRILKVSPQATLPTRAHPDDAGLDLYSLEDLTLAPGQGKVVKTGIAIAVPPKHVGLVADRSSLAKKGVKTAGGVIDAGYRGEIHIVLWNISEELVSLNRGERIAQLLIVPISTPAVQEVQSLEDTARGVNGFGSTGK
jgi:dUTP pyrophosphatase